MESQHKGRTYFPVVPKVMVVIPRQEKLNLWFYENHGFKAMRIVENNYKTN